jgi:hypothetical protein
MDAMIWNTVLSVFIGLLSWVLKEKSTELKRLEILLNKTREEIAKEYVTKVEVHKLDAFIKGHKLAFDK